MWRNDMKLFIVVLSGLASTSAIFIGFSANAATQSLFLTGDRATGLRNQIEASSGKQSAGANIYIENASCETATILVQGRGVDAGFSDWTGCSVDASANDLALSAFKLNLEMASMLSIGEFKNPVANSIERFQAAQVSCVFNSDRCTITLK
jgi:hypothetical protein